jgi:hypothetical protein
MIYVTIWWWCTLRDVLDTIIVTFSIVCLLYIIILNLIVSRWSAVSCPWFVFSLTQNIFFKESIYLTLLFLINILIMHFSGNVYNICGNYFKIKFWFSSIKLNDPNCQVHSFHTDWYIDWKILLHICINTRTFISTKVFKKYIIFWYS